MEKNRELLNRYLDGDCTKEDIHAVCRLLNCHEGRTMLDGIIAERESALFHDAYAPDSEMRKHLRLRRAELHRRIAAHEGRRRMFRPGMKILTRWVAVLVGVAMLGGSSVWIYDTLSGRSDTPGEVQYTTLTNSVGIPVLDTLPDGTQIWLAAGSEIKYPTGLTAKNREVELTGEAFFDVAKDAGRPFIIHSEDFETRVLGTSFKVIAFKGQEHTVAVATGEVSVTWLDEEVPQSALLTGGRAIRLNHETGETIRANIESDYFEEWKSGALVFRGMPLSLIVVQLENRYGVNIGFENQKIASRRMSGTFGPEESLDEILNMLGFVEKFRYKTVERSRYVIY